MYYLSSLNFNGSDCTIKLIEKLLKKLYLGLFYNLYITEFFEKKIEKY